MKQEINSYIHIWFSWRLHIYFCIMLIYSIIKHFAKANYRKEENISAFFGEVFKSLRHIDLSKQLMYNF